MRSIFIFCSLRILCLEKSFFLIFLNPKKKRDVLLKRTNNFVENDEQVNSIWQLFFTVYTFVRFKKSIKVEKVKQ